MLGLALTLSMILTAVEMIAEVVTTRACGNPRSLAPSCFYYSIHPLKIEYPVLFRAGKDEGSEEEE